ncbi:MAG TPA: N,N-dimethylformamidase beta subunit family domain-containing protein [Candidatus Binatia bacterium]|nr:N,N-dimethylformamidase beta subunit family domain-containing protein [Candidatus Binatia bacterium]
MKAGDPRPDPDRIRTASGPLAGAVQPDPPIGAQRLRECGWPAAATVQIPAGWTSGVYLGKLTAEREGVQSYVVFVVRDDRRADFVFQCSDLTWQAYNRWPDRWSLYDDGEKFWAWGPDATVGFDRPYGRYCQIVDAPLSTGSGEWLLWEFPLAYWMESRGDDVTYVSGVDTHRAPAEHARARGFLSVGHDEYYTMAMFTGLKRLIADGLNVAFLSGNTCCGLAELERAGGRADDRTGDRQRRLDLHRTRPLALRGHRHATRRRHPGLVGWEYHGEPADIPGLEIVATGPTRSHHGEGVYTATVYPGPHGNFVFNASSCWWSHGLARPPGHVGPATYAVVPEGPDPRAQRITANVLDRMRRSSLPERRSPV